MARGTNTCPAREFGISTMATDRDQYGLKKYGIGVV
jgi:hypothetical protein